jgi:hypothetical protein
MNDTFPFRSSRWHEPNPRFRAIGPRLAQEIANVIHKRRLLLKSRAVNPVMHKAVGAAAWHDPPRKRLHRRALSIQPHPAPLTIAPARSALGARQVAGIGSVSKLAARSNKCQIYCAKKVWTAATPRKDRYKVRRSSVSTVAQRASRSPGTSAAGRDFLTAQEFPIPQRIPPKQSAPAGPG